MNILQPRWRPLRSWTRALCCPSCLCAALLLASCGTAPLQRLNEDTPDMRQILGQHASVQAPQPWYERPPAEPTEWPAESFPLLPNPMLLMWVHAHLAGVEHAVPVPGYPTAFHLYARNHFALPGETPP